MISALLFINQKGEVVISRMYRDGFTRATAETFRAQVIGNKEEGRSPVKVVGETVFMYIKHGNMFVVAVTSGNAQAAMTCLLYTSPSPRDATLSRMPSSA